MVLVGAHGKLRALNAKPEGPVISLIFGEIVCGDHALCQSSGRSRSFGRRCWPAQRSIRSDRRTVTVFPTSFPIAFRTSAFTGSLCVPSPIAMNELRNGCPSIVPRTLTSPRVPKNFADPRMTT